jgi:hypothetical protein
MPLMDEDLAIELFQMGRLYGFQLADSLALSADALAATEREGLIETAVRSVETYGMTLGTFPAMKKGARRILGKKAVSPIAWSIVIRGFRNGILDLFYKKIDERRERHRRNPA